MKPRSLVKTCTSQGFTGFQIGVRDLGLQACERATVDNTASGFGSSTLPYDLGTAALTTCCLCWPARRWVPAPSPIPPGSPTFPRTCARPHQPRGVHNLRAGGVMSAGSSCILGSLRPVAQREPYAACKGELGCRDASPHLWHSEIGDCPPSVRMNQYVDRECDCLGRARRRRHPRFG
jgi:hypothetical protein